MKREIFKLFWFLVLILSSTFSTFAQTSREKGFELYKQGKDKEAIEFLNSALKADKKDSEVLNLLGLAYLKLNEPKKARKSLEKAVESSPQNSVFRSNLAYIYLSERNTNKARNEIERAIQLDATSSNAYYIRGTMYLWERKYDKAISDADKAMQLKKDFASAYTLKSDALLSTFGSELSENKDADQSLHLLRDAADVLKSCVGDCLENINFGLIKEKLETIDTFYDYFNKKKDESLTDSSTEKTPMTFLTKPFPKYTDAARQAGEQGTVTLAILFGADAKIKQILVLEGLRYGLTDQAITAARAIKFEPAMEAGKPISIVKKVQFSFTIY